MYPFNDFEIQASDRISQAFLTRKITTFYRAIEFIKNLEYGRNLDKTDLSTVFSDNCGTCSTKHAVLKQLAAEHHLENIQLTLGIFKMTAVNTPKVLPVLSKYRLEYLPEAHTYLKYRAQIYDFTFPSSTASDFESELLFEIEIQPHQINRHKIDLHRIFLEDWLSENADITYSLEELWHIREACIAQLSL
ncbi:hypothetical protein [Flavobacterium sp. JP2137]|uniref:hypothetical protein n=1 Tax=Flavobacterium sp. JP2137 TaxID=3414510 RepID=UPI003D2FCEAE